MKRGKTKRELEQAVVRAAVRWMLWFLEEHGAHNATGEEVNLGKAASAYHHVSRAATKKPRSKR